MSNPIATSASRTLRFAVTTALVSMSATATGAACSHKTNVGPQTPVVNEGPAIDPAGGAPTDGAPTDGAPTDGAPTDGGGPSPKLDVRPTGEQTPPLDGGPAPDQPPPIVSVNPGPTPTPPPTPPKPQPKPKVMVNPGPTTAPSTTTKPRL